MPSLSAFILMLRKAEGGGPTPRLLHSTCSSAKAAVLSWRSMLAGWRVGCCATRERGVCYARRVTCVCCQATFMPTVCCTALHGQPYAHWGATTGGWPARRRAERSMWTHVSSTAEAAHWLQARSSKKRAAMALQRSMPRFKRWPARRCGGGAAHPRDAHHIPRRPDMLCATGIGALKASDRGQK